MSNIYRLDDYCMVDPMKAGQRLRQLREGVGISQEELGRRVGQNQMWISYRERGVTRLSVDEMRELAHAMGFSAEVIVSPHDNPLHPAIATANQEDLEFLGLVLQALPTMEAPVREMVEGLFRDAIRRHEAQAAS